MRQLLSQEIEIISGGFLDFPLPPRDPYPGPFPLPGPFPGPIPEPLPLPFRD